MSMHNTVLLMVCQRVLLLAHSRSHSSHPHSGPMVMQIKNAMGQGKGTGKAKKQKKGTSDAGKPQEQAQESPEEVAKKVAALQNEHKVLLLSSVKCVLSYSCPTCTRWLIGSEVLLFTSLVSASFFLLCSPDRPPAAERSPARPPARLL
jgi:hypothetical protein